MLPNHLRSTTDCILALQSPNLATRYLAWTRLHEMQTKAERPLLNLWHAKDPHMRARALQLLARIKGQGKRYTDQAMRDSEPDIRITGLRIARALNLDVVPAISRLSQDPSPAVRRECALALRHSKSPQMPRLWAEIAAQYDGSDRWYLEALGIGADRQWDQCLAAWLEKVKGNWDTAAGRELVWRSRSRNTPALLTKILTRPQLSAAERVHFFRSLDFTPAREKDEVLLQLAGLAPNTSPSSKEVAFEALSRLKSYDLNANGAVKTAVVQMADSLHGQPQFLELVKEFNLTNQEPALMQLVEKEPFDGANVEAVRMLLHTHSLGLIQSGLKGSNAMLVIRALGSAGSKEVVPLLTPLLTATNQSVANRKLAVQGLAQVKEGTATLLKLAQAGGTADRP